MSEGSLLNSIHPLYLLALLLTHKFCLGKYNLFALLYLVFLVDISDWYVKSSFMYVGVRLCIYGNIMLFLATTDKLTLSPPPLPPITPSDVAWFLSPYQRVPDFFHPLNLWLPFQEIIIRLLKLTISAPGVLLCIKQVVWMGLLLNVAGICFGFILLTNQEILYLQTNQ